jgi:hypothetical protein
MVMSLLSAPPTMVIVLPLRDAVDAAAVDGNAIAAQATIAMIARM